VCGDLRHQALGSTAAHHVTNGMPIQCYETSAALSVSPWIGCTAVGHSHDNTVWRKTELYCNAQPAASRPCNPKQNTDPEQKGVHQPHQCATDAASDLPVTASLVPYLRGTGACWYTNKFSSACLIHGMLNRLLSGTIQPLLKGRC
jgi:hypothetical protein